MPTTLKSSADVVTVDIGFVRRASFASRRQTLQFQMVLYD